MPLNRAAGGNGLFNSKRQNSMYRLRERTRKTSWSGLGSPRNAHQGMVPVRCWHNPWTECCDVASMLWQGVKWVKWVSGQGSSSAPSQAQAAVSFRGSSRGGAGCLFSPSFSPFLHFQFSHSISNFLRSEATSWDWKGTIQKKDEGEKTTSNLVKVSFEKSIFLCDKICLRLFVLWNQPIILRERMKEVASVVWNNSD